ncbi:MAG: hypothetical protein MJZ99_07755 [Bacteroidales bacterium]|nr:hypothetical protein [Candidatus Colimorpha merdihippi]MCQ2282504.1 hypothetical protein [Bacteroidales bacterium]
MEQDYTTAMKKLLMFVMVLTSWGMQAMSQSDSTYIPKDLNDCIRVLDTLVPDSTKVLYVAMDENQFIGASHFGLGLTIRNTWGLWRGSRLSEYFNKNGVKHPDDMSGIILRCYHRHLTGKPLRIHQQLRHTRRAWRKQYGRVKTREMEGGNNKSQEENAAFLNLPRIDSTTGAYIGLHGRTLTAQDTAYLERHRGRFHGLARIDTCGFNDKVKTYTFKYRRGKAWIVEYNEFDELRRLTKCYSNTFSSGTKEHYYECYIYQYDSTGLLREKTVYENRFGTVRSKFRYDYDTNGYTITDYNTVHHYHLADGSEKWAYDDDTIEGILDSSYIEINNVDTVLLDENGREIAKLMGSIHLYQYDSLGRQVSWLEASHSSESGWYIWQGGINIYEEEDGRNYYIDIRGNNVMVMYADKHGYVTRKCYQDYKGKHAPQCRRIRYDRHGNPKRIKNLLDGSTSKYHFRYY